MRTWPALELRFGAAPEELVHAALVDHEVAAIDEGAPGDSPPTWRVFFPTAEARDHAAAGLAADFPIDALRVTPIDVDDEDWAARSQASLTAIHVGRIVVAPPWDVPAGDAISATDGSLVLVIQPSMGFGTGHHATTRLCLAALQELPLQGRRVLDVGTGSGVLAIAASRLGAASVLAIDDDPDAIQSARENVALNPGAHVEVDILDLRAASLEPFDVVLANLTGGLLIAAASSLTRLAGAGGALVLSGFMEHEAGEVVQAFAGCERVRNAQEDEWRCVVLKSVGNR